MNLQNNIKKPYLLYVGNAYPHKNLKRLIQAFKIISIKNMDLSLVLVGELDYFYKKLQKKVKELSLKDKVVFAGKVSDKELKELYQNGLIYVFPSLSEGFGLPGLEAMKQGLPVVCSDQGPLPEIYGQAAVYFNPKDIQEIVKVISEVILNYELREKLKNLGQFQVSKYSWRKCAQETLNVYKTVLLDI